MFEGYTPYAEDISEQLDRQQKELGLPAPKSKHPLDGPETMRRFRMVREWWDQAKRAHADWRAEAIHDHDIYDGDQWSYEDAQALAERGQAPLVFNFVKPTVDWLLGSEKRMRVDYRCLPRGKEDADLAETKTKLLKYLQDCNNSEFERSRAFSDAVIAGLGWTEHGWSDDGDMDTENVFERYEDWRNIWWDHLALERDLSDGRYLFRAKPVDLDIAVTYFPDRADILRAQALRERTAFDDVYSDVPDAELYGEGTADAWREGQRYTTDSWGYSDNRRARVYIIECWYRTPARKKLLRGETLGALSGVEFDPQSPAHTQLLASGLANVYDFVGLEMRVMLFAGDKVLVDTSSPYRHNRFPFVPWWGFRKKRDNMPYGLIRNLRDVQDDLNKRRSKALWSLSTNKLVAEEHAFADWDEAAEEMQRPDGILRHARGAKVELLNDRSLAAEHVALMEHDQRYIQSISGITDELMGRETNAVSGRAIEARQEQGQTITAELFDNYRHAFKLSGDLQLALVEQFFTDQKSIRITGERKSVDYVEINTEDPTTGEVINDISASRADFVVDQHDYSATIRQMMFETLTELLPKLPPEVSMGILDLVVDISDLPGKDAFVQRIRQITGQRDADEDVPPEQQQAEQQVQQQQAEQQAQAAALQMAEMEAKVQQARAQAEKSAMEAELAREKIQTERIDQKVKLANVQLESRRVADDSVMKQEQMRAAQQDRDDKTKSKGAKKNES